MSKLLQKYWHRLEIIASIKRKQLRRELLKEFSKDEDFCKVLRELARNTVNRNIPLKRFHVRQLQSHKRTILALSKKKTKKSVRKKAIVQSGGFLPVLIPIVASLLGELLRS